MRCSISIDSKFGVRKSGAHCSFKISRVDRHEPQGLVSLITVVTAVLVI